MKKPFDLRLYLVTDPTLGGPRSMIATLEGAIAGGITLVQMRDPHAKGRAFVEAARAVKALLEPHGIPLIINDRIDVAQACGADGVHVGQSDIDPVSVRRMLGPDAIIGLSVGSEAEWAASADMLDAVDYLGTGPVFATATKSDAGGAIGIAGLAAMIARSHLPIVAIGGIGLTNAANVMASGVDGIAVVSAIMAAADPAAAARSLRAIVDDTLSARNQTS